MSTNIFEFQKLLIPKKTATYNFEPTTSLKKMFFFITMFGIYKRTIQITDKYSWCIKTLM